MFHYDRYYRPYVPAELRSQRNYLSCYLRYIVSNIGFASTQLLSYIHPTLTRRAKPSLSCPIIIKFTAGIGNKHSPSLSKNVSF